MSAEASVPSAREGVVALLAGVALAVAMFWPLALHMDSDVPNNLGDPLLQAYTIAWNGHAALHQPLDWWQANALWPNRDVLAFSDALIGYTPIALLGDGLRAAIWHYNVAFLFAYGLSFAGAYLLARELGLGRPAAVVAGVAFAYSPWRWDQSGHLHVLSSGGIPLCLMLLLRGYRRERPRAVVAGWLVAAWQVLVGVLLALQLLYLLAVLAAVALVGWLRAARPRPPRPLVVATAIGVSLLAAVAVWVAVPYLRVADEHPESRRPIELAEAYSPPLEGFLAAPADNPVWGEVTSGIRANLRAPGEQSLFPGAVVLALAVLGLFGDVWPRRLRIGLAIALAITAILSMGTELLGGRIGFRLLFDYAPGWNGYRTPGRIHTLTTLALALLAAAGAQGFARAGRARERTWTAPALGAAFAVLILLEGSAFRLHDGIAGAAHPTVRPPPAGLAAARAPIMHLPADAFQTPLDDTRTYHYMVWSTSGFPAIENGISGFVPAQTHALNNAARGFPDWSSVAALRAAGIRTVVVHPGWARDTPWVGAAGRPVAGLGIERRRAGDVVLYDLSPSGGAGAP